MQAVCWFGSRDIRVPDVPDPAIINPHDAIVRVTSTAICGSDLHLYNGNNPAMRRGDILGHEFMGEVVETGPEMVRLKVGDRVIVPFPIACGQCFYCSNQQWSSATTRTRRRPSWRSSTGSAPPACSAIRV